ncbi:MAG: hypothetical protein K8S20_12330 [Chloroflexi bacterium]|nr:hypothetical protein [Chloroflexota bacterium]
MESNHKIQRPGLIGMLAAGLWLAALVVEYHYGLLPPGNGSWMYYADQSVFFLALMGYLIMLVGLWQSKAAGEGRFGKISLGIFIAGIAALLIAQVVQWLTKNPDFFLFPVGGILQLLGGLLTGTAVVTAKRWSGWQRFAPLLQGLYYLIVLFIPIAVSNQSPSELTEGLWQVTWFITSLALYSASNQSR